MRPCSCGICRLCWLAENDRGYQRLWGLPETAPDRPPPFVPAAGSARAAPCAHLGAATGELVECPTCAGGRVRLKIFACAVFGTCTPGKRVDGLACCVGCGSYSAGSTM